MNSLTPTSPRHDLDVANLALVSPALSEHLDIMDSKAEMMMLVQDRISRLYARSEARVLQTLGLTERLREGGRPIQMTPTELEDFQALRGTYLKQMGEITEYACRQLIQDALQAPYERESTIHRILNEVLFHE